MEVRIGVQHATRELVIDSAETTDAIIAAVAGRGDRRRPRVLALTDESGRQVVVPSDKLAYVEIGEPESRRVGFGAMSQLRRLAQAWQQAAAGAPSARVWFSVSRANIRPTSARSAPGRCDARRPAASPARPARRRPAGPG